GLYTLDRGIGRGMRAQSPGGPRRYDTAAIDEALAQRRGPDGRFLDGWLGGGLGDEPDLAVLYGYAGVGEIDDGLQAPAERMPGRLVHAELSNDAGAVAPRLAPLDAFVLGFATAPRDVADLTDLAVRAAHGRERPASPWGTGIQLFPIDDAHHLQPAPDP